MEQVLIRLKQRKDFVHISHAGRKFVTKGFILQTLKREKESTNDKRIRVGFTTSKKVGNAVERNRVRRRLREVARLYLPELAKEGYDYVLIGRTACLTYPFLKLVDDFKETLAQV